MTLLISFHFDLLLDEKVVIFGRVVEDDMGLSIAGAADIRTKHDLVRTITTKLRLINVTKKLDVSTATIKLLLVLHGELKNKIGILVGEWFRQFAGNTIEAGIL
jgi:hypothetical protein